MPFIHIRSLPGAVPLDVEKAIQTLSRLVAEQTDLELAHLSVVWQYLEPGFYAVAGKTEHLQPHASHPMLVDFLTPDFYSEEKIANALTAIAQGLETVAGVARENIFIQHQAALSGHVFDQGKIVSW